MGAKEAINESLSCINLLCKEGHRKFDAAGLGHLFTLIEGFVEQIEDQVNAHQIGPLGHK